MRKSTLITTIAMIVVVVVALSTATFAWFSSSTTSQAKQVISSSTEADLVLSLGSAAAGTGLITWSPSAQAIDLSGTSVLNLSGLYSPVGEKLSRYITNNTGENARIDSADKDDVFVNCLLDGGAKVQGNKTGDPTLIRVFNSTNGAKQNVYLTIVINLGTNPSRATKVAAAAYTFYLNAQTSTTDATSGKIYSLGYKVTAGTAGTAPANNTVVTEATSLEQAMTASDITGVKVPYNGASDNTYVFQQATEANSEYEIGDQDVLLVYQINFGELAATTGINMALYAWMDGWTANDSALNTELDVRYIFSDSAVKGVPTPRTSLTEPTPGP